MRKVSVSRIVSYGLTAIIIMGGGFLLFQKVSSRHSAKTLPRPTERKVEERKLAGRTYVTLGNENTIDIDLLMPDSLRKGKCPERDHCRLSLMPTERFRKLLDEVGKQECKEHIDCYQLLYSYLPNCPASTIPINRDTAKRVRTLVNKEPASYFVYVQSGWECGMSSTNPVGLTCFNGECGLVHVHYKGHKGQIIFPDGKVFN